MNDENEEPIEYISKSQMKREMLALQELGEKLVELNEQQLSQIDLSEELSTAISQAQAIKKHGAKRRQLQFIGRLMRNVDAESIQQQLDKITQNSAEAISQHHRIEQWRDRLLADGDEALTEFINTYPDADRQQLRTLIRSTIQERHKNKPPRFYRKMYQLIKQAVEAGS